MEYENLLDNADSLLCEYCEAWPCECGLGYEDYDDERD